MKHLVAIGALLAQTSFGSVTMPSREATPEDLEQLRPQGQTSATDAEIDALIARHGKDAARLDAAKQVAKSDLTKLWREFVARPDVRQLCGRINNINTANYGPFVTLASLDSESDPIHLICQAQKKVSASPTPGTEERQ